MSDRYFRAHQKLITDRACVVEAAEVVRRLHEADRPPAGLDRVETTILLGGLLDAFAENLHLMPDSCRAHVVRISRDLTGRGMDRPTVRRTRRR